MLNLKAMKLCYAISELFNFMLCYLCLCYAISELFQAKGLNPGCFAWIAFHSPKVSSSNSSAIFFIVTSPPSVIEINFFCSRIFKIFFLLFISWVTTPDFVAHFSKVISLWMMRSNHLTRLLNPFFELLQSCYILVVSSSTTAVVNRFTTNLTGITAV